MGAQFAGMHEDLFDEYGQNGSIVRGANAPVPVRVIVNEGVERVGEYGQSIGHVMVVHFLVSEFRPQQRDVLTLLDTLGETVWTKPVASVDKGDGYVVQAVMHG